MVAVRPKQQSGQSQQRPLWFQIFIMAKRNAITPQLQMRRKRAVEGVLAQLNKCEVPHDGESFGFSEKALVFDLGCLLTNVQVLHSVVI